tara:strand:- start:9299 stop:10018 length:720 start_codon:yes stop_codon:yes gene_type:complete
MKERLQKLISKAGISSRRKAELLLADGRVFINGKKAKIGDKGDPICDEIKLDGNIIELKIKTIVILLNKPKGVISSCFDDRSRKTVLDLIPKQLRQGLHPVGRLDINSRGAILLTNNGKLTLNLTHPKYSHKKTYLVWVRGVPSKVKLKSWENGIILNGKKTLPANISLLQINNEKSKVLLKIILTEGRNRQIRRIAEKIGHPVIDLKRIAISDISLENLKEGEWRELNEKKWKRLIIG